MSWRASNSNKTNTNPFEVLQEEEQPSSSPQRQHYRNEQRGQHAERQRLQTTATTHHKPEQSSMIADDGSKARSRYREWTPTAGGDDDEDVYAQSRLADHNGERQVDDLKGDIRNVKQDTLSSTRNALSTITDAQGIATTTLSDLGEQASQLGNVERNIGEARAEAEHAAEQAGRLKRLNRSIFLPTFKNPFQRKARARRELEQAQEKHAADREERGVISQFEHQSQTRTNRAQQQPPATTSSKSGRSKSDRNRYQFEADSEDDAIEDEIDQNLDDISHATGHLKHMATAMRGEIDSQNEALGRIQDKVDPINQDIFTTTHRINKIK